MEQAARQWVEIDRLNAKYKGRFRVFKGIEANILVDGSLDLQPDECAQFEFVVASPHSVLRKTEDQTPRMVNAIRVPGVAILGHPRGRMFNTRPGVAADWDAVFAEAAQRRRGDRARRQLASTGHRLPPCPPRARLPAACSRSTATRIRSASCDSATTPSRTRASRASRPTASSTAGATIAWRSGCARGTRRSEIPSKRASARRARDMNRWRP